MYIYIMYSETKGLRIYIYTYVLLYYCTTVILCYCITVCMSVCMYACMHVCYVCIYIYTYVEIDTVNKERPINTNTLCIYVTQENSTINQSINHFLR